MSTLVTTAEPQHLQALEHANRVRIARAELKRRISSGDIKSADVIFECPNEAETMTVADLLMSQKRWGRARCRKLLASLQLSEAKTIGSLTDRQRVELAGNL